MNQLSWKHGVAIAIGALLLGGTLSALGQNDGDPQTVDLAQADDVPEAGSEESGDLEAMGGPGGRGPGGFHHFKGPHGGLVRSESVVEGEEDGTFNTIRVDRGELTAVDGNTLTIEEADGESREVSVNDDTRIGRNGERAEVGDLEVGDHVSAHQVKEGDGDFETKHVMAISAERYAEMEEQRAEMEEQREACTDNDQSTECERPFRGPRGRGPGGPGGFREQGDVERAPEPANVEDAA